MAIFTSIHITLGDYIQYTSNDEEFQSTFRTVCIESLLLIIVISVAIIYIIVVMQHSESNETIPKPQFPFGHSSVVILNELHRNESLSEILVICIRPK